MAAHGPGSEGSPWRVPLADVRLPAAALEAARATLESGWLSAGPRVERFEDAIREYVGAEHAVACSSGTAALTLAFAALEIGPGDEVVMPSLTFVASANAARWMGARPVFADVIGGDDLTLDPSAVAEAIGPKTRALVLMHYGGYPSSPELVAAARDRGVAVIEDAAHALGAAVPLGACGSWGDAGCFSFFANKNLPLGEGGMLVTSDADLASRARELRSHGLTSSTWDRHSGAAAAYDVKRPGFNYRLDELRAAMGTEMLGSLAGEIAKRRRATGAYAAGLARLDGVRLAFSGRTGTGEERSAHHLATALLPDGFAADGVIEEMRRDGIQAATHYPPIHRLSAYAEGSPPLPRTEALARTLVSLPLFAHIEQEQIDAVLEALGGALGRAGQSA